MRHGLPGKAGWGAEAKRPVGTGSPGKWEPSAQQNQEPGRSGGLRAPLRWCKPAPHGTFRDGLAMESVQNENVGLVFKRDHEVQDNDSRALKAKAGSCAPAPSVPGRPACPRKGGSPEVLRCAEAGRCAHTACSGWALLARGHARAGGMLRASIPAV